MKQNSRSTHEQQKVRARAESEVCNGEVKLVGGGGGCLEVKTKKSERKWGVEAVNTPPKRKCCGRGARLEPWARPGPSLGPWPRGLHGRGLAEPAAPLGPGALAFCLGPGSGPGPSLGPGSLGRGLLAWGGGFCVILVSSVSGCAFAGLGFVLVGDGLFPWVCGLRVSVCRCGLGWRRCGAARRRSGARGFGWW